MYLGSARVKALARKDTDEHRTKRRVHMCKVSQEFVVCDREPMSIKCGMELTSANCSDDT